MWMCVCVWEQGERLSVQCKSLCISSERKRARDTETRRDGCWLLTSVQALAPLSHRCGLYTNGHKVRRHFPSSVSPESSVRSPSRPPPSGWDLTPNWPALTESPAAVSSRSSWWASQEAAAQAAPPTADVWSERGEFEPGTGCFNLNKRVFVALFRFILSDITHLFEERMSCEGGGRWSEGKRINKR